MSSKFQPSKYLVAAIIEKAHAYPGWSLQGLGMFRLYLSKHIRMHVWSPAHRVENVSEIHTHPWDFESKIIAGSLIDTLYTEMDDYVTQNYHRQNIVCGPNGCAMGEPTDVYLSSIGGCTHRYEAGESYRLRRAQIHATRPEPGTITIIERVFYPGEEENATVYFPIGTKWVSAIPRAATVEEVAEMRKIALFRLQLDGVI